MNRFLKAQWPAWSGVGHRLDAYELLPDSQWADGAAPRVGHVPTRRRRCAVPVRPILYSLGVIVALGIISAFWARRLARLQAPGPARPDDAHRPPPETPGPLRPGDPPRPPPLYEEYHRRERNLPQHNLSLPYPDGSHAKFLWTANHGSGFGWGNYMEEMILDAYLAYAAQRAYVFDNYTWARGGPEVATWNGKPIPARIPLSALISGPIIGGFMPDKDVPRAVSREYFFDVCPQSERIVLDTRKVQSSLSRDASVEEIVERWVEELHSIESPCVEIARNSPPLFSYEITNTPRVLDVFLALSQSPILSNFGWSPLILEGYYRNLQYFRSPSGLDDPPSVKETSSLPLNGLLALHVRRGDYESWCNNAYRNRMSFTGFNSFPQLPDKYTPPGRHDSAADAEITRSHCLPSIAEIVEKVLAVSEPHITRVYVMTNAPRPWLVDLKGNLSTARHWPDGVGTSRDLELSWEEKFVAEAVDMYVGQRAEKFIGNGFSSLTSNVVLLRMHNPNLDPSDTHFW
ncbi:hypothetical protein C8F04DRAFT_1131254 [Mycena alexandri]|uniref:O-fucosyltransferase family protein n=1 Tax=Mycena alexandri TaxID=1745969 RepID=A0AAD6SBK4_9AGAR|nr:hypothetical protein C8F04DRAFT_1131254 [Mycena alexandri]